MMDLYSTIVSIYLIVPMVFTCHHKIYLSVKPEATGCNRINDTMHYCYSLIPMIDLLSDYNGSTDVFIQSGAYILNMSYTLKDLNSIQISQILANLLSLGVTITVSLMLELFFYKVVI